MDSKKLLGVPVSATESASPMIHPTTSTGIRAPLTLDDSDTEYGTKDSAFSSYASDSDGFLSGEEGFETGSERAFVTETNDEIHEETHFLKEYVVSRPIVKIADEKINEESSSCRELDDTRPFLHYPDEEIVLEDDVIEDYSESRPFLADKWEEDVGISIADEENASGVELPVFDIGMPLLQKKDMPIAKLSGDSDDDSLGNESEVGGPCLGVVRVPSSRVLEKLVSAPKVRVLEVGEGDDSGSLSDHGSEADVAEDLIFVGGDSNEGKQIAHVLISADAIEDEGPDIVEEAVSAELCDDIQGIQRNRGNNSVELGDKAENLDPNNFTVQETNYSNILGSNGVEEVEEDLPCEVVEAGVKELKAKEEFGAASMDGGNLSNSNVDGNGTVVLSQSSDAEKLVSEIEQESDQPYKPHCYEDHNDIESMDGSIKNNEVQVMNYVKLSDTQVAQEQEYFMNVHSADVTQRPVVLSQSNDREMLVNEIEQKFDQQSKSHCYEDRNHVESMDGVIKESEVQAMNHVKLSDTQEAQEQECFMNVPSAGATQRLLMEDVLYSDSSIPQAVSQYTNLEPEGTCEEEDDSIAVEKDRLVAHDVTEDLYFERSEEVDTVDIPEQFPASSLLSYGESSHSHLLAVDAEVAVLDDDSDAQSCSKGEQMVGSFSLTALLNPATGVKSENSNVIFSSADVTRLFPLEQPLVFDSRFFGLRPAVQLSPTLSTPGPMDNGESVEALSQGEKKKLDRLQEIRVKFLRFVHRLNRSPQDSVAEKVLYQLELAAGRSYAQGFSFDFAKEAAVELETNSKNDLRFSLNVLVIGKSGVGKSATINSIFGEEKATVNAFEPATTSVKEITGTLNGIQVRVLDTPGLRLPLREHSFNRKVLSSIKKFTKKLPPDVVLYVDRIDTQTKDFSDLPLLELVTSYLGSSIWFSTIITLTNANSTPPEGPSGYPLSYDILVSRRSHEVQQLISQSVGNLHTIKPALIPVALVENNHMCGMNKNEQMFLLGEEHWRSQLLLLCYSLKILSELDSVVKTSEVLDYRKLFGFKVPSPSLPYFMPSLVQSNVHPKLSTIEGGENVDSDIELAYSSDRDQESEDVYDQLPLFKPLTRSEIAKLNEEQRPVYRYRHLESSSRFLIRPVFDLHGWDHDCGYDGFSVEDNIAVAGCFPATIAIRFTKGKEKLDMHLNSCFATKHGDKGSTVTGLDFETVGKQLAYILKAETKLRSFKVNKTAAGVSITFLGKNAIAGLKVEDEIALGKHFVLVGSTGVVKRENDSAYGANLEIRTREKNYPVGQDQSTLGLSLTRWKGDLVCALNLQSQFCVGRNSEISIRAGLNSNQTGQVSVRISSCDQLQIAALGLLPIAKSIWKNIFASVSQR